MIKKRNIKRLIKVSYFAFIFLVLLIASEILYAFKVNSLNNLFTYYRIIGFEKNLNKDNCEKSLYHLFKLTDLVIKYKSKKFPGVIPDNYSVFSHIETEGLCSNLTILNLLKNANFFEKIEMIDAKLSYLVYSIGLELYKKGDNYLFQKFLDNAIYLNPDLSHYHVELANFFLWVGDRDKAKEALEYCLKFEYPQEHCKDFKDNNYSQNNIMKVGFLKETIEKIINR